MLEGIFLNVVSVIEFLFSEIILFSMSEFMLERSFWCVMNVGKCFVRVCVFLSIREFI